jgi:hypothetical protein
MGEQSTQWQYISGGVAFAAVTAAILVGVFAGEGAGTTAGEVAVLVIALAFVVAVIAVDVPAAIDRTRGNTFSELLRAGGRQTTIFPWTFGVFAGRWFHPVDDLKLLGIAGPLILMVLTFAVVVAGDLLRRAGREMPSWVAAGLGVIAGVLLWSERLT